MLVYLGVVATAIVCLLSTIALQWVPSYEAALFVALEPWLGAVIAFFLLGETFGSLGFMGAAKITLAIIKFIICQGYEGVECATVRSQFLG